MDNKKTRRCKNGTRKSKKTGNCEEKLKFSDKRNKVQKQRMMKVKELDYDGKIYTHTIPEIKESSDLLEYQEKIVELLFKIYDDNENVLAKYGFDKDRVYKDENERDDFETDAIIQFCNRFIESYLAPNIEIDEESDIIVFEFTDYKSAHEQDNKNAHVFK